MASTLSDSLYLPKSVNATAKILIAGPLAAGKTTMVSTLSEIVPLHTEEKMTTAGTFVDDLDGVPDKTTTTVAMDFGRLTLDETLVLFLFGTPGQSRFKTLWHDLAYGALGALVLADSRRLERSFAVLDMVETEFDQRYAVAINKFDDAQHFEDAELRQALALDPEIPLIICDARDRGSSLRALITLVAHLHTQATEEPIDEH